MKTLLLGGTILAALMLQAANAQTPESAYRFCLQQTGGPFAPGTVLCRYHTLAQCWGSKTSPADFCFLTPNYKGK